MSNRVRDLALSDTGFVFDPYTGATFTVNPTGLCILRALAEGLGREGVVRRLREGFDAPPAEIEVDVDDFVHLLCQQGVLPQDYHLEG
jgi:hypothetical protein